VGEQSVTTQHGNGHALRTLGWAAFLGASWTWCIGMFLPVLLIRDYGLWTWVAFAIPNVVGAAAMGWIVRDADASLRLVAKHLTAVVGFSLVTVAFHVFFLVAIAAPIVQSWFVVPIAAMAMLLAWLLAFQVRGGWLIAAAAALGMSIVAFILLAAKGALAMPAQQGQLPTINILWLVPVMIFGFALCPYLDITFHRARQALSLRDGRLAFGVGFGVFFFLMIILTLLYAPLVITRFVPGTLPPATLAVWLIGIHVAVQAGFTVAAHVRYAGRRFAEIPVEQATVLILLMMGLLVGAFILVGRELTYHGLSGAELSYRLFMAFYGLVFPAYAWICVVPTRGLAEVPRRAVMTFILATLIAAPMYWMGFIERQMVWLLPGVAVVLLAQLVVRWGMPQASHGAGATLESDVPPDPDDETKNFLTASK
jgi:hypothetical protein